MKIERSRKAAILAAVRNGLSVEVILHNVSGNESAVLSESIYYPVVAVNEDDDLVVRLTKGQELALNWRAFFSTGASFRINGEEPTEEQLDELEKKEHSETAATLTQCFSALSMHNTFAPGELVGYKPGLSNRKIPAGNEPAVFIEYCTDVLPGDEDPSSPYSGDKMDCVIGVILLGDTGKSSFAMYRADSRRLKPYNN